MVKIGVRKIETALVGLVKLGFAKRLGARRFQITPAGRRYLASVELCPEKR